MAMENPDMGSMGNIPMSNLPSMSQMPQMQQMQQTPQMGMEPVAEAVEEYQATYPEIYYKLKPYVSMASDMYFAYGGDIPSQQQVEDITDSIYDDFVRTNPDMADYMNKADAGSDPPADPVFRSFGGFRGRPGFGFRRRGLARDFIGALLLSELLGRNGYFYY